MTDPYGDPDLVPLYDADNPSGPDHAFYCALAEELEARCILDLGCGTGLLTRALTQPGRTVTGVDPSETMLAWARSQPGADAVTWVLGDARVVPPTADLDLVLCTGNAVMHISSDDLVPALRHVAAGLRSGGVLAFETRSPGAAQWRTWTPEETRSERDSPLGWIHEWLEVSRTELNAEGEGLVAFDAHNLLIDGTDRVYTSELWFRGAATLTAALQQAGLDVRRIDGGWSGEPVNATSPFLVVQAARHG